MKIPIVIEIETDEKDRTKCSENCDYKSYTNYCTLFQVYLEKIEKQKKAKRCDQCLKL